MRQLNTRVPLPLLEEIGEAWKERGFTSRSEFVRHALRYAVNPEFKFSDEVLEDLEISKRQFEEGKTHTLEEGELPRPNLQPLGFG